MLKNCFKKVYKGKKVLITGHTGFKGAWLSLWLKDLGADVLGYALAPPTIPNLFEAIRLEEKITSIIADICDENKVNNIFATFQPEFVFHLAAQPLVRLSYKEPKLTYQTNIIGTVNLLEAIRKNNCVKVVINVTSDKCYENKEWVYGYREIDPLGGYDPYSSSKACSELITSAYRKSFFNPKDYGKLHNVALATVRSGNVIGGGDWGEDRLIPDCIRALIKKEIINLRNPNAIRPWQYVLEPLSGYLWLGALMWHDGKSYSDSWNFGPSDEDIVTVEDIVKKVLIVWGEGDYKYENKDGLHEMTFLKLDSSKSRSTLRWRTVYSLNESIEKTILWYKKYYKEGCDNIYEYSINQIKEYISKARCLDLEWCK